MILKGLIGSSRFSKRKTELRSRICMEGFEIQTRAHHSSEGYRTVFDGQRQTHIIDNAPNPAAQVEQSLDLPPGETLDGDAVRGLAALFAALASDLRSRKNPERQLTRRMVALAVQLGAIDCTLEDAGRAMNVSRQSILQNGQAALRKLALIFDSEHLTRHNKHVAGRRPKPQKGPRHG